MKDSTVYKSRVTKSMYKQVDGVIFVLPIDCFEWVVVADVPWQTIVNNSNFKEVK